MLITKMNNYDTKILNIKKSYKPFTMYIKDHLNRLYSRLNTKQKNRGLTQSVYKTEILCLVKNREIKMEFDPKKDAV